jgi:serine/threonine protein kinase
MATAPEVSSGETVSTATDVWQLGVLFLQIILGVNLQEKCRNSHEDVMKEIENIKNERLQELLKRLLTERPDKRITIIEVLDKLEKIKRN